ncbi:Protein PLANT CADMIUM RESISTANCE 3, partial [Glycine soja]
MRQQYGLKGNGCTDCLLHCCCESCTLSQEYRELKQLGFDMIIGWHGNVEQRSREVAMTAATAPLVEKGMSCAGKSKGFKDGLDEDGHAPSSPTEVKHSVEPLNTRRRGEEDDGLIHHDSDSKSPTNCPVSVLCGPDSGTNFTGSSSGGSSSSNNNSSNSGGCCSGNVTEVEVEGDEGCCSGKMRK